MPPVPTSSGQDLLEQGRSGDAGRRFGGSPWPGRVLVAVVVLAGAVGWGVQHHAAGSEPSTPSRDAQCARATASSARGGSRAGVADAQTNAEPDVHPALAPRAAKDPRVHHACPPRGTRRQPAGT